MSNVRDSDTSLWLHNKLGTSNDTWISDSICSQLNKTVLANVLDCFVDLQTQVKLKFLLAFLRIPRKNLDEWRYILQDIVSTAILDTDQWVSMMAEILSTYLSTGCFNTDLFRVDDNRRLFNDLVANLDVLLKNELDIDFLPLECHYLNAKALTNLVGPIKLPKKHFTVTHQTKYDVLKAELLQKCDVARTHQKRNVLPTVPTRARVMPRKLDNTAASKSSSILDCSTLGAASLTAARAQPPYSRPPTAGVAQQNTQHTAGTSASTLSGAAANSATHQQVAPVRKYSLGRVKMLDIDEQPLGAVATKKRRKAAEEAAAANRLEEERYQRHLQSQQTPRDGATDSAQSMTSHESLTDSRHVAAATALPSIGQSVDGVSGASHGPQHGYPLEMMVTGDGALVPAQPHAVIGQSANVGGANLSTNGNYLRQTSGSLIGRTASVYNSTLEPEIINNTHIGNSSRPVQPFSQQSVIRSSVILPTQQQPNITLAGRHQPVTSHSAEVTQRHTDMMMTSPYTGGASGRSDTWLTDTAHMTFAPPPTASSAPMLAQQSGVVRDSQGAGAQPPSHLPGSVIMPAAAHQQKVTIIAQPQKVRNPPSLTPEQMRQAQDMFSTANKVTRPEKALILAFIAGCKDNPCPHLGNVVTVKLSEDVENLMQEDGTFMTSVVETHFQMNYSTGEWKKIRKCQQ